MIQTLLLREQWGGGRETPQKVAELGSVMDRGVSLKRRQQHEQRH